MVTRNAMIFAAICLVCSLVFCILLWQAASGDQQGELGVRADVPDVLRELRPPQQSFEPITDFALFTPTREVRQQAPLEVTQPEYVAQVRRQPPPVLRGIVRSGDSRHGILQLADSSQHSVLVGGVIAGWQMIRISEQSVVMRSEGEDVELLIGE